jgi:DNA-binding winged helix-turn-helix (wHTH) protein/TolB-like protein
LARSIADQSPMTADFDAHRIDLAREEDFRLGEILVRPSTRQVEAKGASQTLQPRIMQVLVALARRQGEVVSRDELTQTCWEGRAVGEDAINRCIQQIRKLGETTNAFEVETIPRVGYRLKAEGAVSPVASAPDSPAAGNAPSNRFSPGRRWLIAAAAVGLLLVGGLAAWWINLNSKQMTVSPVTTLAVLPFDALDNDAVIQRMAAAIPRDIADQLSRAGISVTATARSMAYAGDAKARASQELGVDLLLDGSVKREGDRVRISARLYHAKRGVTLWADDLVAAPDDPFVDDRLSALVARTISWPGPLRLLNSDRPNAVEETRAFLRILQFNYNGDNISSREAARKLALDAPDLDAARSSMAIESMGAFPRLRPEERPEVLAFARKEAEVALGLDPHRGGNYLAAALVVAQY